MDGRQFDRWTQTLAGVSRREAIKRLVSAAIAGPVLIASARGTSAQVSIEKCGKNGDHCRKNKDCCNKFTCNNNNRCKKNNKNCGKSGDRCNRNSDCCNNLRCHNSNKCKKK